jgi:hypothetical protein
MSKVRRLRRAVLMVMAGCAVLAFLGAYAMAFAKEPTQILRVADITNSNAASGR